MKHFSSLGIKTDSSLRVKMRTVIFIGRQKSSNFNEETEKEQLVTSNHIKIHECDNSVSEIELAKMPETFKDGGQASADDLNEFNLGTNEDPRPIYVSS